MSESSIDLSGSSWDSLDLGIVPISQHMKRIMKPEIFSVAAFVFLLALLFQNMSLVEFTALNIASVNESSRRDQARELLGKHYKGSGAQRLEGQEYLNFLVYKKLEQSLGPAWQSRLPELTRVLIADSHTYQFDPVFILAIIQTESKFNTNAVGTAGEVGLMQIKPSTAEWIANRYGVEWLGRDALFDPTINIRLGIRYFAQLRAQFDNQATHYVPAYNMGPGNVRKMERYIASTGVDLRVVRPEYAMRVLKNYNDIYRQMESDQSDINKLADTDTTSTQSVSR